MNWRDTHILLEPAIVSQGFKFQKEYAYLEAFCFSDKGNDEYFTDTRSLVQSKRKRL